MCIAVHGHAMSARRAALALAAPTIIGWLSGPFAHAHVRPPLMQSMRSAAGPGSRMCEAQQRTNDA